MRKVPRESARSDLDEDTFRLGYRGAQGLLNIIPLTTLGKIIGGGFPVGATAAAGTSWPYSIRAWQRHCRTAARFSPIRDMRAGIAAMELLETRLAARCDGRGGSLRHCRRVQAHGVPGGTVVWVRCSRFFADRPVANYSLGYLTRGSAAERSSPCIFNRGCWPAGTVYGLVTPRRMPIRALIDAATPVR